MARENQNIYGASLVCTLSLEKWQIIQMDFARYAARLARKNLIWIFG